ncbi:uncharacterized protein LOC111060982 isoform X2 [Nilaparvata lugens]|uniref:uncharacterized protein LOC111060982 isoform X2 n=1 Tax=Nilaparvata lugens TaxID=108931 RepID=UPI00193DF35B|nr:uncharacterized protein LOC111060982 isoform X2 [Nilaparvata lugens]
MIIRIISCVCRARSPPVRLSIAGRHIMGARNKYTKDQLEKELIKSKSIFLSSSFSGACSIQFVSREGQITTCQIIDCWQAHNGRKKQVHKGPAGERADQVEVYLPQLELQRGLQHTIRFKRRMAEIDERAAAAAVQEQEQPSRAVAAQEQEQPARAAVAQEQEQPARESVKLPGERAGTFVYGDGHGFYYHSEGARYNKRFLKCVEKKKLGCLARASMGLEEGAPIMATYASPFHNHFPDEAKGETMVFMATLKEKAKNEEGLRVSQIFDQEADRNPQAAIAVSPINAKKAMKRARGLAEPAIPRTLEQMREEMMLPGREGLKTTKGGEENFLIDLAIKGDAGETLADGFASRRTVEFLRRHPGEASHVMMDATFKIIPRRPLGVHQLFSVHAIYMDFAFLVAIFLMTRKTEDSYRRVLTFVREQLITWPVVRITTDFEVGLINASKRIFPGAQHQGCWFHFTQAIWRYVMTHDLSAVCRADVDNMKVIKMVMALPHLPAQRGPPHSDQRPSSSLLNS